MNPNKPFRLSDRVHSFKFALDGIFIFFRTEHNAWIHLATALAVVVSGFILKVSLPEWCWLIAAIMLVLITEMINTAIEILCDMVSKEINPQIKTIKDISAGAVLIAVIAAVSIGLLIFIPKLF